MSDSLWPHGLQHARLFCPPLFPRLCSNGYPLNYWCYLTISSFATSFSFCLQSFQHQFCFFFFFSDWFSLGLTSLIFLLSKELWRVFSSTAIRKHQFFGTQPSLWSNSHVRTSLLKKPYLDCKDLCQQNDVSAF